MCIGLLDAVGHNEIKRLAYEPIFMLPVMITYPNDTASKYILETNLKSCTPLGAELKTQKDFL